MKISVLGLSFLALCASATSFGATDVLAKQSLTFKSAQPDQTVTDTVADVKAIFEKFQPQIDSGSRIVSPLVVGGTQSQPVIKVSIEKCVLFICKTVDMDAEMSISEKHGSCDRNFILHSELGRSSSILTDVYSSFDVQICYTNKAGQGPRVDLVALANQAPTYEGGIIQQQIFAMLQLQIKPIVAAVNATLKAHSK